MRGPSGKLAQRQSSDSIVSPLGTRVRHREFQDGPLGMLQGEDVFVAPLAAKGRTWLEGRLGQTTEVSRDQCGHAYIRKAI